MFVAKNLDTNKNIYIDEALFIESGQFVCPICGEPVIVRNGSLVTPHFAHKSNSNCDTFTHDMSDWHKWWQEQFPVKNREHIEEMEFDMNDWGWTAVARGFSGKKSKEFERKNRGRVILKHRADVRVCGYVIEFQNSSISREEFNERNWFYTSIGCKVIWVFNMINLFKNCQIEFQDDAKYGDGGKYKWRNPMKCFGYYLPQYDAKNNNIHLFFQTQKYNKNAPTVFLEKVVWAIEDESGESNFKTFITKYSFDTPEEFIDAIKKKEI